MQNNNQGKKPENGRSNLPFIIIAVALLLLLIFGSRIMQLFNSVGQEEVSYDTFLTAVEKNDVEQVEIGDTYISYLLRADAEEKVRTVYYTVRLPGVELNDVVAVLQGNHVEFAGILEDDDSSSLLFSWIILPLIFFFGMMLLMRVIANRSGGGGMGGIGGIGKSKAKVYMEKETGVTFRDVAGQDEAKE